MAVTEDRISDLPLATTATGAEVVGNQGGTTKRIPVSLIGGSGGAGGGAPLSNTGPQMDAQTGAAGIAEEASRADHRHPRDNTLMPLPTGTKAAGRAPLVGADGVTVSWSDLPTGTGGGTGTGTTGTALVLGNNKLVGTGADGVVVPLRGAVSSSVVYEGAPIAGTTKLYLELCCPCPVNLDQLATAVEGTSSPSLTIAVEKVTAGVASVLGGLSAFVVNSGSRDNPTKTTVSGARGIGAGDVIRVRVTAASGTITAFSINALFNRLAG